MSLELIGILGVGVTSAGLILTGKRDTDRRIDVLATHMSGVERRMAALERRMAHLEGLLAGLGLALRAREATTAAAAAGD